MSWSPMKQPQESATGPGPAATTATSHPPVDNKHAAGAREVVIGLKAIAASALSGGTTHPESVAASQAAALNILFSRLAELAMSDTSDPHFHSLMRLAFRAQHLCIRTLDKFGDYPDTSEFATQFNAAHRRLAPT